MINLKMKSLLRLMALVLILFAGSSYGLASENTDDMTEEQKALQAEIEHSLVAPCCWNMTVDQHESPASRQVRAKIAELVEKGQSRKEILRYFSSPQRYGERILASPSQDTLLGKSAYWLIPIAFLLGTLVVATVILKWTAPAPGAKKSGSPTTPRKPAEDTSPWAQRVEEELKNLES
ncbi:MAG: cytochrome c-type biogenesis protein CcmH [bacterium]